MLMLENTIPFLRRHRKALVVLTLLLFLAATFFVRVGDWLIQEDTLEKAPAIAVLSGRLPSRALEAAKLYRAGYAKEIWLTRDLEPTESLKAYDIRYISEDFYNLRVLVHEGVPVDAIHTLEPPILNTADEMKTIAAAMTRENAASVIIVTSKVHTRRTRTLWHHLIDGKSKAIVWGASDDGSDPVHWWRNTKDALDVVREVLGLLNAWAGLPLHPRK